MTNSIKKHVYQSIPTLELPYIIGAATPFFNVLVEVFSNESKRFDYFLTGVVIQTCVCTISMKLYKRFVIVYVPILLSQLFLVFEARVIKTKYDRVLN